VSEKTTMSVFERYLSLWVAACMALGILAGKAFPAVVHWLRSMELGHGSQINIPIAVLIWLMIYPMMLKVDFASIRGVGRRPTGLFVTVFVNWLVKPFSMAGGFFTKLFAPLDPAHAIRRVPGWRSPSRFCCARCWCSWSCHRPGLGQPRPLPAHERPLLVRAPAASGLPAVTILALLVTLVAIFAFQAERHLARAAHPADRRAHPAPGLLQLRPHVRPDALLQGRLPRRGARRVDRRVQLLRAGGATAIASMDRVRAPREHSDLAVDHGRFGVIADPLRMVAK
jgi:hypothetical protein